ncbi:hypothetical protein FACS1894204_01130 [Synergistales bacterium]|nr:hypothetical protein AGMMS49957_15780 [Synergistales bacterium]GHV44274.1 hypothetical protein FACS1894204_01130 [Synergistales bacterium]
MFDTNILISAGLFYGGKFSRVVADITEEHNLVLSSVVIDELRDVANRKFPHKKSILDHFLQKLSFEMAYTPDNVDPDIFPKIRDEKDYPILASAIIADVDVLITGDKDFEGIDLERPEIMTIKEFEEKYL